MDREVQFLLHNMPEDSGKVQVVIRDETIWCTKKAMAQLFEVGVPAVSKHLKNIFYNKHRWEPFWRKMLLPKKLF